MKLGKKPATFSRRDLKFSTYRSGLGLPTPPGRFGHEQFVSWNAWQMLGNNSVGNCVLAGAAHETMLWCAERSAAPVFSDASVIGDYSAITGYNPADPSTDQGTDVRVALKYRQDVGIADEASARHKIGAYVGLQLANLQHLYEALYLFGVVGIGLRFPSTAMDQFSNRQPWGVVPGSSIDGGHYVPIVARRGVLTDQIVCVTWGCLQPMTPEFYLEYCDEAWGILSPEMLGQDGRSLEGFDLAALREDLAALNGETQ